MRFATQGHASRWYRDYFEQTVRIVAGDCYHWETDPVTKRQDYVRTYEGRAWFVREIRSYQLHPAVVSMMLDKCYMPAAWGELLLEWPHKSMSDPNRLAYTRDERAGEADRQTLTTIGKYLTRHFPHAPSDVIRDMVAQHTYGGTIAIERDLPAMIRAVMRGPSSCMSHSNLLRQCADGIERHPYAVYDPSLGWSMAVRTGDDGEVLGRCLLWHDADADQNIFVRSYKREPNERSHTGRDEAIEAWLTSQGYKRFGEWPDGTPLMCYELRHRDSWLMPYIDGGTQHVDIYNDECTIQSNGEYAADNTDGSTGDSNNCTCEACGARYNDEEEGGWVGLHEDSHVCQSCLDNDYTYVTGRRGNQYYIPNDEAVYLGNGDYYDVNYLGDNNIVELANGDYSHTDNAVYIESTDEWYDCDDDDICYAEDTNEYELRSDCWFCNGSNYWYTDAIDYVEVDGEKYHPDHAPEVEEETNDDTTETN